MNNYQILGLKVNATQVEIKAAYKKLVMIHHPDRGGNSENFIRLQTAYEELLKGITGNVFQQPRYNQQPQYQPRQTRQGSYQILSGEIQKNGDFHLVFRFTNIRLIEGRKCLSLFYFGSFEPETHLRTIIFEKEDLKRCDYNLTFKIKDFFGNSEEKEIKVKRPKLSTAQKIVEFIKELF